jgi:hypothetical protein
MNDRSDWCFVSGLISARAERLLDERGLAGLREADAPEELRSRLRASVLFHETPPGDNPAGEVSDRLLEAVRDVVRAAPEPCVGDFILMETWWRAFRAFAKRRLGAAPGERNPARTGQADVRTTVLEACWDGVIEDERLQPLAEAAQAVRDASGLADGASAVDRVVDAYEAQTLNRCSRALDSEAINDVTATWVHLQAAQSLTRARELGWDAALFLAAWQRAGVDAPELEEIARGRPEELAGVWDRLGLPGAAEALRAEEPALALSRRIDARISELAREALGVAFGPEPVFAFLWALRNEAKNLKLVITAHASGMSPEDMKREVRT